MTNFFLPIIFLNNYTKASTSSHHMNLQTFSPTPSQNFLLLSLIFLKNIIWEYWRTVYIKPQILIPRTMNSRISRVRLFLTTRRKVLNSDFFFPLSWALSKEFSLIINSLDIDWHDEREPDIFFWNASVNKNRLAQCHSSSTLTTQNKYVRPLLFNRSNFFSK